MNIIAHYDKEFEAPIEANAKGTWRFTTHGWGFCWRGSYKQAKLLASKDYSRLYEAHYGIICVTGYKPFEEVKQLELDL